MAGKADNTLRRSPMSTDIRPVHRVVTFLTHGLLAA